MTAEQCIASLMPMLAPLPRAQRVDLSEAIADAIQAAYLRGRIDGRRDVERAAPTMPAPTSKRPVALHQHGVTCVE